MAEYIDREQELAFQDELEPVLCWSQMGQPEMFSATKDVDLVEYLQLIPAANVQPVKRGEWIALPHEYGNEAKSFACSRCGRMQKEKTPYCAKCGAKMEEKT